MGGVGKNQKKNSCKEKCHEKKFGQRRWQRKNIHAEGRSNIRCSRSITKIILCFDSRLVRLISQMTFWFPKLKAPSPRITPGHYANSESISQSIPERREPDRMSEYKERKPMSKGLFARVKCKHRNARTSAILSVFPTPCESVSLQKSCYVAGSLTFQSFPDFLNLSESCRSFEALYHHSRIFEFLTACPKTKILRMHKNVIVFL